MGSSLICFLKMSGHDVERFKRNGVTNEVDGDVPGEGPLDAWSPPH